MGIRTRRAHQHSRTHVFGFGLAGVLGFVALLALVLAISLGATVESWLEDLPDYTSADAYLVAEPTLVYDADGNEIASYYLQNRRSVTLDEISDYVVQGTVATEDKRFYEHNGIDTYGIMRAVVSQVMGGSEGASTITQQLVRNTVLSDEQFEYSLKRKVREAYIAIQMEKMYTKDQILNMYLNTIYYGHNAYGIEAASITYFNKHASELSIAEAATLVGIPQAPSSYDPTTNPEGCKARRDVVLSRMLESEVITQEEYESALAEDLVLDLGEISDTEGTYPYFTDYVRQLLLADFSSDTILQGGLKVYTTIEPDKQAAAEQAASDHMANAGNDEIAAALVSIDNTNGHVVAMVGGQSYGYDTDAGESTYNLATSTRQAGSSFKTFMLVAALEAGMSPDVLLDCSSPMQITPTWLVRNYNNNQYGIITLARATELSSNTAYAQVVEAVGVSALVETAHELGISSSLNAYPSLVLGASEVSPLEMCEAYSTIASGGVHRDAVFITRIEDRNGNVVYEHEDDPEQVVDSAIDADVIEVLEGVVSAGYTTSYVANYFSANQPVAGKTGTSDIADNLWFCGFTPQYTTVVWAGNRDNTNAAYYGGSLASTATAAQPIWTNYMNTILSGLSRGSWPESTGTATYLDNSSWTFVGTAASVNNSSAAEQEEETEEVTETTTETTTTETTTETTTSGESTTGGSSTDGTATDSGGSTSADTSDAGSASADDQGPTESGGEPQEPTPTEGGDE